MPIGSVTPFVQTAKSAAEIAETLGGRRCGSGWIARCPAHEDRRPSLSIRDSDDERVLVHCHAGCPQEAVIEALRRRNLWRAPREWLPREEYLRRLRARREAERRAAELAEWRRRRVELLVRLRNLFWDRARLARRWWENEGLALDLEHPHVVKAAQVMTDCERLGDRFARAVEQLERLRPSELEQLRRRLERREVAA